MLLDSKTADINQYPRLTKLVKIMSKLTRAEK